MTAIVEDILALEQGEVLTLSPEQITPVFGDTICGFLALEEIAEDNGCAVNHGERGVVIVTKF